MISYARNQSIIVGIDILLCSALVMVGRAIRETNLLTHDCMHNIVQDLLLMKKLRVSLLAKAAQILEVCCCPSPINQIKINTDGAALGLTGPADGGGIFCTAKGLVKGFFAFHLGAVSAFEAELLAVMSAIEKVKAFG